MCILWTEQLFHIKKPIIAMLHPDALKMLCFINFINFINTESDRNPDTCPQSEIARSTIFKAHPDGLCISANAAGQGVDDALIASVKQAAPEAAVLCNTGCRPDTIARKLP